jgi:hypothetical protein
LLESCRQRKQRPEELTFAEYVRYVDAFRPSKDDELRVANKRIMTNPTPLQIRKSLKELRGGDDSFAIYAKSGSGLSYMQTDGDPEAGFVLEYQAGSLEAHFICTNRALSLEEIIQAFSWYAAGDDRWRSEFAWEGLEL